MGILSSTNVLYLRIAFLTTIAFFCIKDVNSILQNSYFLVLTHAMNLPILTLSQYSGQLGLFSVLFAMLAVADLLPLLERNRKYFESVVPFRLTLYFIIVICSYLMEDTLYVHNNAVFIYSFAEVWMNFVIFNSLREERNEEFRVQNQFMDESAVLEEPEPFVKSD